MTKNLKLTNYLILAISCIIIASFIIVGSFLDFDISKNLYNPTDTNVFGIIGSILAEVPTYLCITFAGTLFLSASKHFKDNNKIKNLLILLFIIALGCGLFFGYWNFYKLRKFESIGKGTLFYVINAIELVLIAGLNALIVYFTLKKTKDISPSKLLKVAIFIVAFAVVFVGFYQVLKYVISRPRPRYVLSLEDSRRYYQDWWDLSNIFKSFTNDEYKSCPSGHSATAMALPFILIAATYLKDNSKNSTRLIIFVLGFIFALAMGFSRVLAGAHYLSDVGLGFLISFVAGVVIWNIFIKKYKIANVEEKE